MIKKKREIRRRQQTRRWRESRYDEKEKLIQSHHLNIKTFPQTPLDCVIQLSAFYFLHEFGKRHTTIDNSCLMKMLRFCISQMSFFMDFIIIAANSCCCCMDYTRDTTPSNQEKRTLYKTLTFRTFISIPTKKKTVPIFDNPHFSVSIK